MAKHITVRAAQPDTKDQEIEPTYITITGCFPYSVETEELEQTVKGFAEDAKKLFDGLRSLPGGTFDQLLILMLQKTASSFIVPHNFHDEEKPKAELCPHGFGFVEYCPKCREASIALWKEAKQDG